MQDGCEHTFSDLSVGLYEISSDCISGLLCHLQLYLQLCYLMTNRKSHSYDNFGDVVCLVRKIKKGNPKYYQTNKTSNQPQAK